MRDGDRLGRGRGERGVPGQDLLLLLRGVPPAVCGRAGAVRRLSGWSGQAGWWCLRKLVSATKRQDQPYAADAPRLPSRDQAAAGAARAAERPRQMATSSAPRPNTTATNQTRPPRIGTNATTRNFTLQTARPARAAACRADPRHRDGPAAPSSGASQSTSGPQRGRSGAVSVPGSWGTTLTYAVPCSRAVSPGQRLDSEVRTGHLERLFRGVPMGSNPSGSVPRTAASLAVPSTCPKHRFAAVASGLKWAGRWAPGCGAER